ncbi:MAG: isoleucine--tRNA ligase [bacterium]
MNFKPVDPTTNFPALEQQIQKFWKDHAIFERSIEERPADQHFTFYDGPPFATGLPHYGSLLHSVTKDIIPRYWTMRGYRVTRRWGWDCHGLPIENLIEKELGLRSKRDIEAMGIGKFNETCRNSVLRCATDWEYYVNRLGRWVDFKNDYKTMNPNYMESIWWVFRQLWDKGLLYQGHKSMHVCPRCSTPLSNFEVTLAYKDDTDPSVVVKFPVTGEENTYILAWTTTPWTLPANILLAVGQDIDYVKLKIGSKDTYILAEARIEQIIGNHEYEILEKLQGKDLVGTKYTSLFEKELAPGKAYEIVAADYVSIDDGTGIVHIAPAYGEDDLQVGQKEGAPFFQHITMDGFVNSSFPLFEGQHVWKTNPKVIDYLKENHLLFHHEEFQHSYPHCWRCDSKLINYATSSWFVAVTKIKDDLIALNDAIHWVPDHIQKGRFGEWLKNSRDWAISRSRYWGTPLPVWKCTDCDQVEVVTSREELEKKSGEKVPDLHKHCIDQFTWKCEKCPSTMQRIPDVLDCWFESGAMPYASNHYPFENQEWFQDNFPADFIGEGIDQTRGWFYTLHVLGVALFGKPAARNILCTGLILAEDGQKMSKSKKNYPDPLEILDKHGADALRFYMVNSPVVQGENLNFSEKALAEFFRNFILMLWNSYSFFITYANAHNWKPTDTAQQSTNILDQWILSRLHETTHIITKAMDNYQLYTATRAFQPLLTDLSKWYIRRSRDRFADGDQQALQTLYTALLTFSKILSPYMPFITEAIYQNLTGIDFIEQKENALPLSIHLSTFPEADEKLINEKLHAQMDNIRTIAEVGNRVRKETGLKVRQPLASLTVKAKASITKLITEEQEQFNTILQDELNVKAIIWQPEETPTNEPIIEFDTTLTPTLLREGAARELIRHIQSKRAKLGLKLSDTVTTTIDAPTEFQTFITQELESIRQSTSSQAISWETLPNEEEQVKVAEHKIKISVKKQ